MPTLCQELGLMLGTQRLNHLSSQSKVVLLFFQGSICLHCMHWRQWGQKIRGKVDTVSSCYHRIDQVLASPRPAQRVKHFYFPSSPWERVMSHRLWLPCSHSTHCHVFLACLEWPIVPVFPALTGFPEHGTSSAKIRAIPGKWRWLVTLCANGSPRESLIHASMHYALVGQMQ